MKKFGRALFNPVYGKKAIAVALFVGSVLFVINHGMNLIGGKMTSSNWISAGLTYVVPYMVHIFGQLSV